MFIELHDLEEGYRVLINTSQIMFVDEGTNGETCINVQNECYSVKESYEYVRSLLNYSVIN